MIPPRLRPYVPRSLSDWAAAALFGVLVVGGVVWTAWIAKQSAAIYRLTRGVGDTVFYGADGKPWFRMNEQHLDVPLAQIAPDLQHAVIAVEDHRFYFHPGVDPIGIGRALHRDISSLALVEGASTLTQQLARTLFLSNRRTYGRKFQEAVLAALMETQLKKAQILELYLDRVYLGAGVYGVEPMSLKLFGKSARDLSLAEAALVAGLIRAPATLSPWSNLDAAVRRSHVVLARMREEGFITAAAEAGARQASIRIRPYPEAMEVRGGYAKEYLRQQFRARFGGDHPPDWQVRTTFMPALQDAAERAVAGGARRIRARDVQIALVALDSETGNILALVGGRDYRTAPLDRATRSHRQPGSAFKPFVYAAALEHGYSPVSLLSNLSVLQPQGPDEWVPRNAKAEVVDELTLRAALLESNNRAAVALQQQIGSGPVLVVAKHLGLTDVPDVPSLALGTGLVTPLELTAAFAAFPNGGFAVKPRGIARVVDADGDTVIDVPVVHTRAISEGTAFQVVSMLQDVIDRGTGSAARRLGVRFPAGGKTGTTNEFKDAWFVGFSSSIVAGVWVGYDRPASLGREAYGAAVALPIWAEFMREVARVRPPQTFLVPTSVTPMPLCRLSYQQPVEGCPTYVEHFKEGDQVPSQRCALHSGEWKEVGAQIGGFFQGLGRRLKGIFR